VSVKLVGWILLCAGVLAVLVVVARFFALLGDGFDLAGGGECADDRPCQPGRCAELRATVRSPDGRRIATVLRTNGGATTAFGARVCVDGQLVAQGYQASDTSVDWDGPTALRVHRLSEGKSDRVVDVTSGVVACEPVRSDWSFCSADGTAPRRR
jgi:hypothetical protein